MELSAWLLYATFASLNILSPGPAILLAISNTVSYGIRRTTLSSIGNVLGLLCLAGAVMVGVMSIFNVYPLGFTVLKILGAGYLIFLGIRKFRSKDNIFARADLHHPQHSPPTARRLFMNGYLLAVTNPKPMLFFASIYPQFIDAAHPLLPQFLIMTATFMAISFMSLMGYSMAILATKSWLSEGRRIVWFNRFSGAAFVILGLSMLVLKGPG